MYAIANRTSVHVRRNYLTVSLAGLFVAEQQGEAQPPLYLDSLSHTLGQLKAPQHLGPQQPDSPSKTHTKDSTDTANAIIAEIGSDASVLRPL